MKHFWLTFVINEAIGVLSAYVTSTNLIEAQKAAILQAISALQQLLTTL